ncbi:MAG: hypothetical protein WCC17_13625 [Candidatus Nitrosopolaris sp.]
MTKSEKSNSSSLTIVAANKILALYGACVVRLPQDVSSEEVFYLIAEAGE